VYSEGEYLNGAGLDLTTAEDWPAVEPAVGLAVEELPVTVEPGLEPADESTVARESAVDLEPGNAPIEEHVYDGLVHARTRAVRLRRIAGVAMLAGAVGTVGGVVGMNMSRARHGAGRGPGSLVARSSRVVSSSEFAGSRSAPSSAPSAPAVVPRSKAPSSSVAHAGLRHRGARSHLPNGKHAWRGSVPAQSSVGVGVRRGGGVAIVLDYSPRASMDGSTAASSSVDISRPSSARAAVEQVEFGFER
jgi:hypothetical protein